MAFLPSDIDQLFARIEAIALAGERCPQNHQLPTGAIRALCKAKKIKVEVYAHNYRVVTLLDGPHRGKRTAEPPNPDLKPYLIVDSSGSFHPKRMRDQEALAP